MEDYGDSLEGFYKASGPRGLLCVTKGGAAASSLNPKSSTPCERGFCIIKIFRGVPCAVYSQIESDALKALQDTKDHRQHGCKGATRLAWALSTVYLV